MMKVAICVILLSLLQGSLAGVSLSSTDLSVGSIVIGTVDFIADDDQVCAMFNIDSANAYKILVTHVHFGDSAESIPQDGSRLLVRRFQNVNKLCCKPTKSDTVCVARSCPYSTFIAAHAYVQQYEDNGPIGQYESAWANSAASFEVAVSCSEEPTDTPQSGCETTWAKSQVDNDHIVSAEFKYMIGDGPNAWGWAVCVSTPGTYTADIWAGAGQNDLSKGSKVGLMEINLQCDPDCTISVKYIMDSTCNNNNILTQGHVQFTAGTENVYTKAPGSLTFKEEFSSPRPTYSVTASSYCVNPRLQGDSNKDSCQLVNPIADPSIAGNAEVCILAHGVACGFC